LLEGGGTLLCSGGPRWRGPGHPGLASDGKREWIAVHAYDANNNGVPTLRLSELRWRKGWPEAPDLHETVRGRSSLEGTWEHTVDTGAASMVVFEPNGAIDNTVPGPGNRRPAGGRWMAAGSEYKLVWPSASAPGGAYTDTVRVQRDGLRYDGTNEQGKRISGKRIR